ncbi:hypothetical protein [Frankia tisae]|nr:hypothetical protein [Frankia tisae]
MRAHSEPEPESSRRQEIRTFVMTTSALLELRDRLAAEQVPRVNMRRSP